MSATDDLTNQPGHDLGLGIDQHSRSSQCSPAGGSVISLPLKNQEPRQGHADQFPLGAAVGVKDRTQRSDCVTMWSVIDVHATAFGLDQPGPSELGQVVTDR